MPTIGDKAPDFELLNQDGKSVKLSDYRGQTVVLFAFPKANTMGCNIQACSFRDEFLQFESADAVILGISTDSPQELKAWKEQKHLQYDLLSDPDHQVLDAWDAWGINLLVIKLPIAATRSFWVINAEGIVVDEQLGISPQGSVDRALSAIAKISAQA